MIPDRRSAPLHTLFIGCNSPAPLAPSVRTDTAALDIISCPSASCHDTLPACPCPHARTDARARASHRRRAHSAPPPTCRRGSSRTSSSCAGGRTYSRRSSGRRSTRTPRRSSAWSSPERYVARPRAAPVWARRALVCWTGLLIWRADADGGGGAACAGSGRE